jgi:hypothetical protein
VSDGAPEGLAGWGILVDEHQEIWSGWHQSTIDLTNIPVARVVGKEVVLIPYKPAFRFYNDANLHTWELEGAYIDDVLISGCPELGTVTLSQPTNGGDVCTGTGVWCCWEEAEGASSYRVQWAFDASFSEGTIVGEEVATGTCFHRAYARSGPIYWRVRPENSCRVGSWSGVWSIILIDVPPVVSVAKPPDDCHMCSGGAYEFAWAAAPTAIGYTISWFSYFPEFPETAWTQEPHKYLTLLGDFAHWKVRATNQCGDGDWSTLRTVYLDGGPLPTSWDLTNEVFSDVQVFEATNKVTAGSDVSIVAPGEVTFESPLNELRDGFSVGTGGTLTIKSNQPSCG